MVDYSKGKVYRIVCNVTGKEYIGSTCQRLSKRLSGHRTDYAAYLRGNHDYVTSFAVLEGGDYDIVLMEACPCGSKEELHQIERRYIDSRECVNKVLPLRTRSQYRHDNADKIKQYASQYDQMNKEHIKARKKIYRQVNKEAIRETKQKYREKNRTEILEKGRQYMKTYYQQNKQAVLERQKARKAEKKKAQAQAIANTPTTTPTSTSVVAQPVLL